VNLKKGLLGGLAVGGGVALILILIGLLYPGSGPSDESGYLTITLLGIAGWPLSSWYPMVYIGSLVGRSLPVLINFALAGVAIAAFVGLARTSR
jgi:hypothetical protein